MKQLNRFVSLCKKICFLESVTLGIADTMKTIFTFRYRKLLRLIIVGYSEISDRIVTGFD